MQYESNEKTSDLSLSLSLTQKSINPTYGAAHALSFTRAPPARASPALEYHVQHGRTTETLGGNLRISVCCGYGNPPVRCVMCALKTHTHASVVLLLY